jgi:GT2 family glycosyltransferase
VTVGAADRLVVSVVVPTYRRPELLLRCLQRLCAQTLPADAFEIVVVDDGRDDATHRLVEQVKQGAGEVTLIYLWPPRGHGPAVARNAGWRAARGAVIAFTDDDTLPEPGWLEEGLAALALHPEWVAAGGCLQVPLAPPASRRPSDHELMTMGLERAEFVTANAFVRRAALKRLGGFDERFTRAWREDSDLQFRLMRDAGPVGRAPGAVVLHPARPERWGVCLRQQRNALFEALLFKKHPRLYRERIDAGPPWRYYAIVSFVVIAVLAVVIGLHALAAGAVLLAAAGMLWVAATRLRATSRAPMHVLEMVATSAVIPFLSVYWRLRGAVRFRVFFF